ncbi:MAG: Ig-like domain-containing protein [Lachnospiraceae bacterium]|nr:Ig-like domain-containing protein [Lachnospiraceae bacterium]
MTARSRKSAIAVLLSFALVFQWVFAGCVTPVNAEPESEVFFELPSRSWSVSGNVLLDGQAYTNSLSDNDLNWYTYASFQSAAFFIQTENVTETNAIKVYRNVEVNNRNGMVEVASDLNNSEHGCAFAINDHCIFFFAVANEGYYISIDYDANPENDPLFCIYPCEIDRVSYKDLITYDNPPFTINYGAFISYWADPADYEVVANYIDPSMQTIYYSFDGTEFRAAGTDYDFDNGEGCKISGTLAKGKDIHIAIVPNSYQAINGIGAECKIDISKKEPAVIDTPPAQKNTVTTTDSGSKSNEEVKAKSISFNYKSITLKKGSRFKKLKVVFNPSNTTNTKVTWKSSNDKVVKVTPKGVLIAKKNGSATITATTSNGKKARIKVKVGNTYKVVKSDGKTVKSIKVDKTTLKLKMGKKHNLKVVTDPEGCPVTYKSSDSKIATVNKKGMITAKKKRGSATITISANNGKKTKKVKVTVG